MKRLFEAVSLSAVDRVTVRIENRRQKVTFCCLCPVEICFNTGLNNYITSEVSISGGQRFFNLSIRFLRVSSSNGWTFLDKRLTGVAADRWDAGTIFCWAFKKSCFSICWWKIRILRKNIYQLIADLSIYLETSFVNLIFSFRRVNLRIISTNAAHNCLCANCLQVTTAKSNSFCC